MDLLRSIHVAWGRGDFDSVEWAHPDVEYAIADGPSPGRWTGLAGMGEGFGDMLSAWDGWRVEADEYRELGDRVLVLQHFSGRGKTSGLEAGQLRTEVATCSTSAAARSRGLSSTGTARERSPTSA